MVRINSAKCKEGLALLTSFLPSEMKTAIMSNIAGDLCEVLLKAVSSGVKPVQNDATLAKEHLWVQTHEVAGLLVGCT